MGKPKPRRPDRPAKRKFNGNQHAGPTKKMICEQDLRSVTESIDASYQNIIPHVPTSPSDLRDVKTSASSVKLKQQTPDVVLDKEDSLTGFRFIDLELLIEFVQKLLCPECKRPIGENQRLSTVVEHRTNQASKVVFTCQCQHKVDFLSSKKCGKVFEANRRFPLAIFSLGKNHCGAKRFLGNMNMPPPPHKKSWQNHKKQCLKATRTVASECSSQAVAEVKTSKGTDVIVSVDGTWQRRGFSSKNGVVTVLSVNGQNSKVLDTVTLANYCNVCAKEKNSLSEIDFQQWQAQHTAEGKCQKNHTGSAGSMEPEGAERIFRRSEEKHGLRYTHYLGDGDSKSYSRIKNADPPVYDGVEIAKLECCGHVQKRMGRQLTNKVTELKTTTFQHDGKQKKGIGGRGGLKKAGILTIQGHYGAAIRGNVGNVPQMRKAIWAIWEHRNRQHTNCGNWCPTKKHNGVDPNKNSLPSYIMDAIKPVFVTLTDDSLLQKCAHGGTQNTNESFHHLIWERCPKTTFCGRDRIELAVADATIVFNSGEIKRTDIFVELKMEPGFYTTMCFMELDGARIQRAEVQGTQKVKQQRQQRALDNAEQYADTEEYYLSGAHE
ncbi:uncharacterized protein [Littorina saxatilis]|uniref:uncharacterized protein n=1 Tax=Littorina saxatilis TaxID=31220 RepID=UPI0038B4D59D